MLEVGAFEAKNTLGSLLDRVEAGEEVRITRHGKPIARLIPDDKNARREASMAAMERIRALARTQKIGPFNWEEIKKDRDEGRP
jgi:prevent-host-death family protein